MAYLCDWKAQNRCIAPGLTTKGRIRLRTGFQGNLHFGILYLCVGLRVCHPWRTGLSDRFPAVLCHSDRDEPH